MTTLELEMMDIKARLGRLEAVVWQLTDKAPVTPPVPEEPLDNEQLLAWMRAQGLIRDPTPQERRLAAEWDALPEEEKQAHIDFMDSLDLDPLLSEIILENRS